MSTQVCQGLKQMGAKKGDVLAMFLPNCMEYPVVFGAATNAGKVISIFLGLNYRNTSKETCGY